MMKGLGRGWRRLAVLVAVATSVVTASALLASGAAGQAGKGKSKTALGFEVGSKISDLTVNEGTHVILTVRAVRNTNHTVRLRSGGVVVAEGGGPLTDIDVGCSNTRATTTVTATDIIEEVTTTFTITWTGPNTGPC